jgi:pyruvate/2-oxoglutarate dehydrogenase complex dihydrolipoamide dehydrogenase (E3) component
MKNFVDVAVIGAGTAGLAAYRAARASGASAVIIEGGAYGTTCARVGCMPSKLLIAAAEAAHAVHRAPAFGVHVDGPLRIDGREVMARVRRERDRFVGFVIAGVENIPAWGSHPGNGEVHRCPHAGHRWTAPHRAIHRHRDGITPLGAADPGRAGRAAHRERRRLQLA